MKKHILLLIYFHSCILFTPLFSQQLKLSGTRPSFQQGAIDTEVLAEVIQEKQEEVKKKVFTNTVVKFFNESSYTQELNNFTTYNYMYGIMDALTGNKDKTVITKSLIKKSVDFGYVFGLQWLATQDMLFDDNNLLISQSLETVRNFVDSLKQIDDLALHVKDGTEARLELTISDFNTRLDMCFDILLKDNLNPDFEFERSLSDPAYLAWYNQSNTYILKLKESKADSIKYSKEREVYKTRLVLLLQLIKEKRIDGALASRTVNDPALQMAVKQIANFINSLSKHKYKEFSIAPGQFVGLKFVLYKLIDFARNQTPNNVISSILEFTLENTFIDYVDEKGILQVDSINNSGGYITIQIEALISSIYDKFSGASRNGVGVYIKPYFSIGTNTIYFPKTNTLGQDADGNANSIDNLYFASEKIGIKILLWNFKYTHSHAAGTWYSYYGYTKRFKKQPLAPVLNDIYFSAYASGLLYQIAVLNSDDSFHYPIFGQNIGVTFFNGLSFSAGIGYVWQDNYYKNQNHFYSVSIDIPIIDYLSALKQKNN